MEVSPILTCLLILGTLELHIILLRKNYNIFLVSFPCLIPNWISDVILTCSKIVSEIEATSLNNLDQFTKKQNFCLTH